jgi:DNA-binding beta-propeller fold protein YncE
MRARHLILFLLSASFFIDGCPPSGDSTGEQKTVRVPVNIILQSKIEGEIFGENLFQPWGIAVAGTGEFFVVDDGNNRLLKFDRSFQPVAEASGFGSSEGLLNSPKYIAIDNNQYLYVTDVGNRRISMFNARFGTAGVIDLNDPDDSLEFGRPAGVAVAGYGELWVSDLDNSRIAIFKGYKDFAGFIGGVEASSGYIFNPAGMRKDQRGNVYACDAGKGVIKEFDKFGIFLSNLGSGILEEPFGLDFDTGGNIWVVDAGLPGILCFGPDGSLLYSSVDDPAAAEWNLRNPRDIGYIPDDYLVVTNSGDDRLIVFKIVYSD